MAATKELNDVDNVVMTSDALDLMACFQDGLDEIVVQIAEEYARRRAIETGAEQNPLLVTAADVRAAGKQLTETLRGVALSLGMKPITGEAIREMNNCLECQQ